MLIPTRQRQRGTVRNTSPKAQGKGLPFSTPGLICANRGCDPPHAIGTRGIGGRVANASGTLTGMLSLCSRNGLVLMERSNVIQLHREHICLATAPFQREYEARIGERHNHDSRKAT